MSCKLVYDIMFNNHFKTAFRNLIRYWNFTLINITGLAVGIAVCMMIFFIIQFHTSFDDYHSKKDRIYRVLTEYHYADAANHASGRDVPFPLPEGLKLTFPQIEQVTAIFASHDDKLLIPDDTGTTVKAFKEQKGVFYAEPSFFKIFDFPLLEGSYESLKDPNNVLITKEIAEKYFGDWKRALGKTIMLQLGGYIFEHGTQILKVSGILASVPANTDFQLKLVVAYGTSFSGSLMAKSTDWEDKTNSGFGCYVLMPPNTSVENFNRQLAEYSREVHSPDNYETNIIQPLSAVHFDTPTGNYSNNAISRELLNVLWLIAAFILLIACINFVNLSTAQAARRAKEIGVKKVFGSSKSQLQIQFIIETFLLVVTAVISGCVVTVLALPYIIQLLEISLSFSLFSKPSIALFIITMTIVVTALAAFYPSVVLSGFNPADTLKSKPAASAAMGITLRRSLVVFQFIIAQALIIGTLITVKQMNYFLDQPLGFDKETILSIPFRVDTAWSRREDYLKQQLLSVNGVKSVSFSSNTPAEDGNDMWSSFKFDHSTKEADFKAITKFADDQYVAVYKLKLIAGRNLQPSSMTREFLVNESLMNSLGITNPDDILNREISIWGDRIKCPVVGVLKDFKNRSFRNNLAPVLITTNGTMYRQSGIKLETSNLPETLKTVKTIWEQTIPNFVYEYQFLDDKIAGFYKQESQLEQLYIIFAAIAIFLSCLGLYGLALFMSAQRIKEAGIRKVHGASSGSIAYIFSKEFGILITIAFVIAATIAWYYMHNWLQEYAYRINLSWWLFAAGGLIALIIALATISYQAIKIAFANPVDSLRSE